MGKEFKDDSVGTIYKRESKNGKESYLAVNIDLEKLGIGTGTLKLVGFKNKYKKEAKHPDIRLMKAFIKKTGDKDTTTDSTSTETGGTDVLF